MAQLMDRLIEPRAMPMKVSIKGLRRDGSWMDHRRSLLPAATILPPLCVSRVVTRYQALAELMPSS